MENQHPKRKTRHVKDRGKYYRHKLKKLLKKASKSSIWVVAVLVCAALVYWVLITLFSLRPLPQ
jgi:hypothetical protein